MESLKIPRVLHPVNRLILSILPQHNRRFTYNFWQVLNTLPFGVIACPAWAVSSLIVNTEVYKTDVSVLYWTGIPRRGFTS